MFLLAKRLRDYELERLSEEMRARHAWGGMEEAFFSGVQLC